MMTKLPISPTAPTPTPAVFAYGFRPFFLAAAAVGPLLVICWLAVLLAGHSMPRYFDPLTWHAHEMLFGFAGAMVAGFLLTAVPNWTGSRAVRGAPLIGLVALWVAGRVAPLLTSSALVAVIDLAFLPALASVLAAPLLTRRDPKTLVFLPILLALWVANALTHAQALLGHPTAAAGLRLATGLIVLMIAIIGGRVIPFFTVRALPEQAHRQHRWPAVEVVALACAALLPALEWLPADVVVGLCLAAGLAHLARMGGWCLPGVWSIPLLWVLYTGYAWIPLGFFLKALAAAGLVPATAATHAFTTGAMGIVGLGIMARASLGHTGRPLQPSRLTVASFVLLNAAALVRVGGPLLELSARPVLVGAGWLWALGFALFLVVYTPILSRPRADGQPG